MFKEETLIINGNIPEEIIKFTVKPDGFLYISQDNHTTNGVLFRHEVEDLIKFLMKNFTNNGKVFYLND